jgi:hypothetical protein
MPSMLSTRHAPCVRASAARIGRVHRPRASAARIGRAHRPCASAAPRAHLQRLAEVDLELVVTEVVQRA